MKKTIAALASVLMIGAMLVFPAVLEVRAAAGDDCRASCEIRSKQCASSCGGDTDCVVRCQQARANCAAGCR